MAELKWQKVHKVLLTDKLITKGSADRDSDLVKDLARAEVAFDGAFLHIKPEGSAEGEKPPVTVVPAAVLKRLTYERSRSTPPMAAWQ